MPCTFFHCHKNSDQDHLKSAPFLEFTKALANFKKTLETREEPLIRDAMNYFVDHDHGEPSYRPSRVWAPLNRAKRILTCLQKIESRFKNGNCDNLDENDLTHLRAIIFYTEQCLPDDGVFAYSKTPMISSEELKEYKKASDSLNKLGHPYQKLSGHVLQMIGIVLTITIAVLSVYFSLGLAMPILLVAGGLSVGAGTYLARPTPYRQLNNEISKTVKSKACEEHAGDDPDLPLKQKLRDSVLACLGGY